MFNTFAPVDPSGLLRFDTSCPSPGTARVAVTGEIDLSTTDLLRARLFTVFAALHPRRIEVDLAGVTFLDCGGLSVLVVVGKLAAGAGCQLRITNPQPVVSRILGLTGLLGILTAEFDPAPLTAHTAGVTASVGILVAV
jgi:anti-anti-sigma factor